MKNGLGKKLVIRWGLILCLFGMMFASCNKAGSNNTAVNTGDTSNQPWKPKGTVTIYCVSAAGGATDYCNRAMAQALSEYWGVTVQVVNQTGGSGGIAAGTVWNNERNGLHLLGFAEMVFSQRSLGVFDQPPSAWDLMPILNTVGVLSVAPNSPYKTISDVIAGAKTRTVNMGSGAVGAVWTLKAVVLEQAAGIKFNHLNYEGSVPSQTAAMSGEVDVVLTGLAEQIDYLKAGRLIPLAMIENSPSTISGVGTVPAITDVVPSFANYPQPMQCIGIALPADSPQEIRDAYQTAFIAAMQSKTIKDAILAREFSTLGQYGAESQAIAIEQEKVYSWALYDAGQAPTAPSTFGIARP
jgi:tripartite-type tricarboxylate transporter receptor subunit TctC